MKTRTAAFDAAWADKRVRFALWKVEVKRRYWNGSAYVLESSATTFYPRDIERIGAIIQRFDSKQARISVSNVSISFKNTDWKWLPTNITTGFWRPDSTATLGYDPIKSQVVIYYAYELADGTSEYLAMFTGLIDEDPQFDSKSGVATFTLIGKAEQKLKDADATNVCTTLTNQVTSPANGNSVITSFSTAKKSLWQVSNVRAGGVAQDQGDDQDYTLGNLNDPEVEASIEFTAVSVPGAVAILWDGKQWHRGKTVAQLVGLLCDEAGIGSSDRDIEDTVFEAFSGSESEDTKAEFDAGTLIQNIDTATDPGRISKKWVLYDNLASLTSWTTVAGSPAISSGKLSMVAGDELYRLHDKATGTWEFKATITNSNNPVQFMFLRTAAGNGYSLAFSASRIYFVKNNSFASLFGSEVYTPDGLEHTYRITRDADGNTKAYVDGTLYSQMTATEYNTCEQFRIIDANTDAAVLFDDLYFSSVVDASGAASSAAAVHESKVFDLLAAPSSWVALSVTETLNGGAVAYETNVSSDGVTFDGWVATNAFKVPQSNLKQFIKVRKTLTLEAGSLTSPVVGPITINFTNANLLIGNGDFTGMTCLDAIQQLAELGGMEYGSYADGRFFFRNRAASGAADLELSQSNAVISLSNFSLGYREVKNVGQVTYGRSGDAGYYFAEYGATQAAEASPTSEERFGTRPVRLELSNLVFSQGSQIATAIARKIYENGHIPKRRVRAQCRMIPHIDISDLISLSFHDSPLIEDVIFGDPMQDSPAIGPMNTLARDILMKVVGITHDIMKAETHLDLEEVL